MQNNQRRDLQTGALIKVEKLEPLALRKTWLNDLVQAVALLESLNLAHGDLRPDNVLIDRGRLKLSDFDCTAQIGTYFDACIPRYGRVLNSSEADQGQGSCGGAGFLGPRTELFALGSLYYLINYGFEVYGNQCLTPDNPGEHGPSVVKLLQSKEFPTLDGDPVIDDVIDKCWRDKYATVADLAAHTERVFARGTDDGEQPNPDISSNNAWRMIISRTIDELWSRFGDWREFSQQGLSGESIDGPNPRMELVISHWRASPQRRLFARI